MGAQGAIWKERAGSAAAARSANRNIEALPWICKRFIVKLTLEVLSQSCQLWTTRTKRAPSGLFGQEFDPLSGIFLSFLSLPLPHPPPTRPRRSRRHP